MEGRKTTKKNKHSVYIETNFLRLGILKIWIQDLLNEIKPF